MDVLVDTAKDVLFLLNLALVAVPDAGVMVVNTNILEVVHNCAVPAALVVINKLRSAEYSIELILLANAVELYKHQPCIYLTTVIRISILSCSNIIYF
jgi:hypothetical protein